MVNSPQRTLVNALVSLSILRVGARVLVIELPERSSVEVRSNAQHPGCWDGVQGLGLVVSFGFECFRRRPMLTKLRVRSKAAAAIFAILMDVNERRERTDEVSVVLLMERLRKARRRARRGGTSLPPLL